MHLEDKCEFMVHVLRIALLCICMLVYSLYNTVLANDTKVKVSISLSRPSQMTTGVIDLTNKSVLLNSGYNMPIMGLGTYALDFDTCVNSINALFSNGGRVIDTAYFYRNEDAVGYAIKHSNVPREEIFFATKLYPNQYSYAKKAIDDALNKSGLEYFDMMLLHHPGADDVEAYKAMESAVKEGKIRSLGLSNYYIKELKEFLPKISITPAVIQNEIHPYYQDNDVVSYIQNLGLGIVIEGWYPFGGRGYNKELLQDKTIHEIAASHDVSFFQTILRWNLQRGVVVIPGSSNPLHIKDNLDIFNFELTSSDMDKIKSLNRNEKHDWY